MKGEIEMSTLWITYIVWFVLSIAFAVIGHEMEMDFLGGFCIWTLPIMFYLPFFI